MFVPPRTADLRAQRPASAVTVSDHRPPYGPKGPPSWHRTSPGPRHRGLARDHPARARPPREGGLRRRRDPPRRRRASSSRGPSGPSWSSSTCRCRTPTASRSAGSCALQRRVRRDGHRARRRGRQDRRASPSAPTTTSPSPSPRASWPPASARCAAARASPRSSEVRDFGHLIVDPLAREVKVDGDEVELTKHRVRHPRPALRQPAAHLHPRAAARARLGRVVRRRPRHRGPRRQAAQEARRVRRPARATSARCVASATGSSRSDLLHDRTEHDRCTD